MNEMEIKAWFDGACWPVNPGGYASYGAVIFKDRENIWEQGGLVIPLGGTSNNLAEYAGYIAVLNELERRGWNEHPVIVHGDSKLVITQMKGERKIKRGLYMPLARKAKAMTQRFSRLELKWIKREDNAEADALASKVFFIYGTICTPCIAKHSPQQKCKCYCHKIGLPADSVERITETEVQPQ